MKCNGFIKVVNYKEARVNLTKAQLRKLKSAAKKKKKILEKN